MSKSNAAITGIKDR